jgi:hypothetical protein
MTAKVFHLHPVDLVDVYCGLLDLDPDIALHDPRIVAIMNAMSLQDMQRVSEQLRADSETKVRRARALKAWLRRRAISTAEEEQRQ